jgi:hypothetical protein
VEAGAILQTVPARFELVVLFRPALPVFEGRLAGEGPQGAGRLRGVLALVGGDDLAGIPCKGTVMNNGAHSLSPSASCRGRAVGHPEVFQPLETFFPIIGKTAKIFSIHWKTPEKFFQSLEKSAEIFQPLEKNFPIIGKIHENFPTIGKKLSNHWKTSPAALLPSYFVLLTSRP